MRARYSDRRSDGQNQWRSLILFSLYRISVASLFLVISTLVTPEFLEKYNPSMFVLISVLYTLLAVASLLLALLKRPAFEAQVLLQVCLDIAAITSLMHFSGGVSSGLGMLLIAVVAASSLLIPGRLALLFAALATIAVLTETIYSHINKLFEDSAFTQAGLLGASLFATALLAMALARRARESQALAEERGLDLANLAQLNDQIVNRMQSGIVVIDDQGVIKLINKAARNLFGLLAESPLSCLQDISSDLQQLLENWNSLRATENPPSYTGHVVSQDQRELRIRFMRVGSRKEDRGSILYVEDDADIRQQVQATKLASLGRLTASIAHEIRNPLGAISHAAQLLDESPDMPAMDRRLVGIINDHTARLNRVIENVLGLSRKQSSNIESIHLHPWLQDFIEEFARVHKLGSNWCEINIQEESIHIEMDPNHLHQVLWNLCTNACKYAVNSNNALQVSLTGNITQDGKSCYLDFSDNGPGIGKAEQAQLFEPFFTTSGEGTGLGLYISRELCQNNGGNLSYIEQETTGSCFRIHFPATTSPEIKPENPADESAVLAVANNQ